MSGDNIQVAVKSRPLLYREKKEELRPQWLIQDKVIFQTDESGHRISEPYGFDHIFTEDMSNADVYNAVVNPLVKSFLNGFNSTIFAYGQTSSGKTHTMMGTEDTVGIIQMAVNDIFYQISQDTQRRYLLTCSYFEIYNEKINDLLDKNEQDIKIREDCCGGTFINAKEEVVTEQSQVFDLMKTGSKIRKIGCTNMNERSSRSHTIFRLTIKSVGNQVEHGPVQVSHLNLVDLAGSERVAHTKAAGVRLKEGVNINKSLLALGNVIRQLSEGEGFINYRDSNLTRLLQNALGGNARSLIIATITLAAGEETKSTLEFAQKAKVVRNRPVINEILSEQDKVQQYKLVTASYKERLEKEKQRILEMEQEKEEREREIRKLKQQVKLIDLFTNGPEKKMESRVPRRHTMGSYTMTPLPTIPEARALSPSDVREKSEDDDQLFLKVAQRASEGNYVKIESLDDDILSVTPEPEETLVQEGTPDSQLRVRLKHLEESYRSLKEFTKLEAECKEDKHVLSELVKEKENLMKEVVDLNVLIKDTRREKEAVKEELHSLTESFKVQKKKLDEFAFALDQAESEKDRLRVMKEQLLNDNEVVLEQQRLKYEKQIEYFTKEIERLNNLEKEKEKVDYDFEEEIRRLREENESNRSSLEKIPSYEQKIVELEEKLQTFERGDDDVLSVATQTDKDTTMELKEILTNKIQEMKNLQEENKIHKEINIILKEETCIRDRIIAEINNTVRNLEKINFSNKNEIEAKEEEISKLKHKINDLEKEYRNSINTNNKQMLELNTKIENLEEKNTKLKTDFYNAEIQSRDIEISELTGQINSLKKQSDEEIQRRDKEISELTIKVKEYERSKDLGQAEIECRVKEITGLNIKIKDLEKINKTLKKEAEENQKQVTELLEKIKASEQKVSVRDSMIKELSCEISNLELCLRGYEQRELDLNQCYDETEEQVKIKDQTILELTSQIKHLEGLLSEQKTQTLEWEKVSHLHKNEIYKRDNEILILTEKMRYLNEANKNNREEITELTEEIQKMKKNDQTNKDEIQKKNVEIFELSNRVKDFMEKIENKTTRLSSGSSADLSTREFWKRKRHSVQDQRRGIDSSDEDEPMEDLKEKIRSLEAKIEALTEENNSLEAEVQGFIGELEEVRRYRKMDDEEIESLKKQLEEAKTGQAVGDCEECAKKQDHIKKMETAHKDSLFRMVDLQTKVYELQNHIRDKLSAEGFTQTQKQPEMRNARVQCDLVNCEQLLEKYSNMKKLARMRRNEANVLRERLGMKPDEPVIQTEAEAGAAST